MVARVSRYPFKKRDLSLEQKPNATPGDHSVGTIISALERELLAVDKVGAHIAAAYLDSAIQQLRLFLAER
jgi:hypothetical protein